MRGGFMKSVDAFFQKLSQKKVMILGFALILILIIIELAFSASELNLMIFYLIPIIFIAWYGSRNWAFFAGLICSLKYMIINLADLSDIYLPPFVVAWNSVVRIGIYWGVVFVLSLLKNALDEERLSYFDPLVASLANKKGFYAMAAKEKARVLRYNHPLTLCYMDIDMFNRFKEQFGQAAGNQLLKAVVDTIVKNIRFVDTLARMEDAEFSLLMPETSKKQAKSPILKIHSLLSDLMKANNWPVSFSIGVVSYNAPESVDDMLKRALQMKNNAKGNAKNPICFEA